MIFKNKINKKAQIGSTLTWIIATIIIFILILVYVAGVFWLSEKKQIFKSNNVVYSDTDSQINFIELVNLLESPLIIKDLDIFYSLDSIYTGYKNPDYGDLIDYYTKGLDNKLIEDSEKEILKRKIQNHFEKKGYSFVVCFKGLDIFETGSKINCNDLYKNFVLLNTENKLMCGWLSEQEVDTFKYKSNYPRT